MEKKFRALRIFGTVYKVIGIIVLVLTVIGAAGTCILGFAGGAMAEQYADQLGSGISTGLIGALVAFGTLIGGAISGLSLYAAGELIYLFIGIEENTRASVSYLSRQTL